jgi:hypothetical protein
MEKLPTRPRHPVITKMLDAMDALPWDWPDEENELYCLSNSVSKEIEKMGQAKFIAFIFLETKSSTGRKFFFLSPKLWGNNLFSIFMEVLDLIKDDDLACYHFVPMLYDDFGIDVRELAGTLARGFAWKYCERKMSELDIKLLLEQIPTDRIERMEKEGAPVFKKSS